MHPLPKMVVPPVLLLQKVVPNFTFFFWGGGRFMTVILMYLFDLFPPNDVFTLQGTCLIMLLSIYETITLIFMEVNYLLKKFDYSHK